MISFLAPVFLIGFIALAVPIIIHLWSKNTKKAIFFGSIRFLKETETRTMRSLMPSQWLLLITRLILLSLLVLILSEMYVERPMKKYDSLYLVDTRYENTDWHIQFMDTLSATNKAAWLADDFQEMNIQPPQRPKDYWELLASPPQIQASKMIIISPLLVQDFSGKKRQFPVEYQWVKLPVTPQTITLVSYEKNDQIFAVETDNDEWMTSHTTKAHDGGAERLEVLYCIKSTEEYANYKEIFEAALSTLQSLSPFEIRGVNKVEDADWVFWFTNGNAPERNNILTIDSNTIEQWKRPIPGIVQISNDWTKKDAIEINLPEKILDLFSETVKIPDNQDIRTIDPQIFSYKELRVAKNSYQENAGNMIWVFLILALITERWLAFKGGRK